MTASTRELRIGVIGAGGRGGLSHHSHDPENGVSLVAGCDIRPIALKDFQEKFGDSTYITDDYRKLLEEADVDAVFVTTPDNLHEEHAIAALEAGKDVYCEKPVAITIEGADRILETAYNNNRKLYCGHNMRHMDFVLKMKQLIDDGAIGEVKAGWCRHFVCYGGDAYFKDWHAERANSTSLLLQKGAHDIDVLHWLCGGFSKRVNAFGNLSVYNQIDESDSDTPVGDTSWRNTNWPPLSQRGLNPIIDVEDLSMMQMVLDNEVICSYQQCHYAPDGWRNYTIIGTEGRIENFGDNPGDCVVRLWNDRSTYNPYGDEQFYMKPVEGGHGGADPSIVDEFVRYIRDNDKVTTSPVAARYSVAAGVRAAESLRSNGQPYDIPPLPSEIAAYFNKDLA
jgi:predicted dehydrogenase